MLLQVDFNDHMFSNCSNLWWPKLLRLVLVKSRPQSSGQLQCTRGHVIAIWAFRKQPGFPIIVVSHGQMIVICNFPCWLSKINNKACKKSEVICHVSVSLDEGDCQNYHCKAVQSHDIKL